MPCHDGAARFPRHDAGDPQTVQALAVAAILTVFALAEIAQGRFFAREAPTQDNRLDLAVTLMFPVISLGVLAVTNLLCQWLVPQQRAALAHWPWWQMLALLLVADDLTQYFWHRPSHTLVLWPLHRAHHWAAYMSVRVVTRAPTDWPTTVHTARSPGLHNWCFRWCARNVPTAFWAMVGTHPHLNAMAGDTRPPPFNGGRQAPRPEHDLYAAGFH